jgi:hypothetical protein
MFPKEEAREKGGTAIADDSDPVDADPDAEAETAIPDVTSPKKDAPPRDRDAN